MIIDEVENKLSFNLLNLENQSTKNMFKLSTYTGPVTPQVSDSYNVFIYDLKTENIGKIDFKELDIDIFSMDLRGNVL